MLSREELLRLIDERLREVYELLHLESEADKISSRVASQIANTICCIIGKLDPRARCTYSEHYPYPSRYDMKRDAVVISREGALSPVEKLITSVLRSYCERSICIAYGPHAYERLYRRGGRGLAERMRKEVQECVEELLPKALDMLGEEGLRTYNSIYMIPRLLV